MPSIAALSPMDVLRSRYDTLVRAAVPPLRALGGDALTARAIAMAGLAAVLALPALLLASLLLDAPLAVPSAIASGYLAVAHALASDRPHRAAFMSGLVLSALVGWLILYLAESAVPLSRSGLAAAIMAPLFAAAPAFARSLIAPAAVTTDAAPLSRAAALQQIACLDDLAPSEPVLIADAKGCVLAATRAARRRLRLLPDAFEQPILGLFETSDVPEIVDALRRCRGRGEPVKVPLQGVGENNTRATWIFSPLEGGAVSLRLSETPPVPTPPLESPEADDEVVSAGPKHKAAEPPAHFVCNIGEAVAFALRRAQPRAEARGIALACVCDGDLEVGCDRQAGRCIAHLVIDVVLAKCACDAIRVDVRKLKGIVLLQVSADIRSDDAGADAVDSADLAALRALVDGVDGTLVVDRRGCSAVLSVRLPLADVGVASKRTKERAEAA